jgi:hypothetical protein
VHYVGYEHLIDYIDRFYRCADTREKLVIGGGIFALKEQGRTKQCQPLRPLRNAGRCDFCLAFARP